MVGHTVTWIIQEYTQWSACHQCWSASRSRIARHMCIHCTVTVSRFLRKACSPDCTPGSCASLTTWCVVKGHLSCFANRERQPCVPCFERPASEHSCSLLMATRIPRCPHILHKCSVSGVFHELKSVSCVFVSQNARLSLAAVPGTFRKLRKSTALVMHTVQCTNMHQPHLLSI